MKKEIKKVLFHSSQRTFRTTLIGYLYEICQVYPVIFLSEEFDEEIKEILENKKLFPNLEKIIFVHQHTGPQKNIFKKNRDLYNLAKKAIYFYKPDVVIAPGDLYPFDMYLMRFAKRIKAVTFSLQSAVTPALDRGIVRKRVDLTNAHLKFPKFLPLSFRLLLTQCRKYLGHVLYYWILPILVGEKPFFGKTSYILREGTFGMRDADYQIVFSKRDYDIYQKVGVPAKKLYILKHPLERETRSFFESHLLITNNYKIAPKTATLLLPSDEVGFRNKDYSLISKKERIERWLEIVKLAAKTFKGWKIFIKPHPDFKSLNEKKNIFESISDSVEVVNPSEPVDRYIKMSDVIIGMPRAATDVLFYTSLVFPEKTIISLDFDKELVGDLYKDFDGIEYIDDKNKFIKTLNLVANNKYPKKYQHQKELKSGGFSNTIEMLNCLYLKKKQIL